MAHRVVDTNVLVIANDPLSATPSCASASVDFLEHLKTDGSVAIDTEFRILREYLRQVSSTGSGAGSAFIRWLFNVQADPRRCEQVELIETSPDEFAEFPSDARLATFDRSDRKFVAVACASRRGPAIANSADRGWRAHETALMDN